MTKLLTKLTDRIDELFGYTHILIGMRGFQFVSPYTLDDVLRAIDIVKSGKDFSVVIRDGRVWFAVEGDNEWILGKNLAEQSDDIKEALWEILK